MPKNHLSAYALVYRLMGYWSIAFNINGVSDLNTRYLGYEH